MTAPLLVTVESKGKPYDVQVRLENGTDLLPLGIERLAIEIEGNKLPRVDLRLCCMGFNFEKIRATFDLDSVREMAKAHGFHLVAVGPEPEEG